MQRVQYELVLFSALLASCCTANQGVVSSDVVINKVQRTVDLASHLPKITSSITVENGGGARLSSFLYAVDPNLIDRLSFIGASVSLSSCKFGLSTLTRGCLLLVAGWAIIGAQNHLLLF